jgi:hypothetical protein
MIHALVMTAVVRSSQVTAVKAASRPNLLLTAVMVVTVSVLMAAHTCEIVAWSLAYGLVDAAPANTDLLYFAFVNYTTLGYGDVVPVERWRLLGPMTAMNGVLLFGWSTAVIFEVLRKRWVTPSPKCGQHRELSKKAHRSFCLRKFAISLALAAIVPVVFAVQNRPMLIRSFFCSRCWPSFIAVLLSQPPSPSQLNRRCRGGCSMRPGNLTGW